MNVYSVEKIRHEQRHFYAGLFDQYNTSQPESSFQNSCPDNFCENSPKGEDIFFIVLKNQPEPVPVGFIQLYSMDSQIDSAKATHVNDLFVLPDYRNNGVALKLIEAAVKFAIDNKSDFIQLKTLQDNLVAQKLFESVGFTCQPPLTECRVYTIQFS